MAENLKNSAWKQIHVGNRYRSLYF